MAGRRGKKKKEKRKEKGAKVNGRKKKGF